MQYAALAYFHVDLYIYIYIYADHSQTDQKWPTFNISSCDFSFIKHLLASFNTCADSLAIGVIFVVENNASRLAKALFKLDNNCLTCKNMECCVLYVQSTTG